MPLDSHSYLVDHGWRGTGNALREGAISRPIVVAQKKSLAGVGKDRDEAFPFWEHVFTAAATSIRVKLYNDDENTDTPQLPGLSTPLNRTSTGIISSKPQKVGLSALETLTAAKSTGTSVMALAKRESARRSLYSQFFRGPILGPDIEESRVPEKTQRSSPLHLQPNDPKCSILITEQRRGKKRKSLEEDEETGISQEKGKSKRENETKEERRERRRLKKEAEKGKVSEAKLDDEGESGLAKISAAPESLIQDDLVDHSRKRDRRKKRKRKERGSAVRHDG